MTGEQHVLEPLKVVITNCPESQVEEVEASHYSHDARDRLAHDSCSIKVIGGAG